jgi:manganese transport protein
VDLLVVGSHGHGLVRDLLFGQTVDRVRHQLNVPMLIARPGRDPAPASGTMASPSASVPTLDRFHGSWNSHSAEEIAE